MNSMRDLETIAGETFLHIARENRLNGTNYTSLLLDTDNVDSTYDPDVKIMPVFVAGYWPGGIDVDGHQYISYSVDADPELDIQAEQRFIRKLLVDAVIAPDALERHDKRISDTERAIIATGAIGAMAIKARCTHYQIPFSYVMVGQVVESRLVEPGSRTATLYYPMGLSPETSLNSIREQVKATIAEEAI